MGLDTLIEEKKHVTKRGILFHRTCGHYMRHKFKKCLYRILGNPIEEQRKFSNGRRKLHT